MLADAERILEETSRTFALPIRRLPRPLKEAVASGYLCMRAIDEVEDHASLAPAVKSRILRAIAARIESAAGSTGVAGAAAAIDFDAAFAECGDALPEVTRRLAEWCALAPAPIRGRVLESVAAMAGRMAGWVDAGFVIADESDLDRYTFAVAGAVGLLLCDLWAWHCALQTNRTDAVGFGRGLQAVNILRNRADDLSHGVDFFPRGWSVADVHRYARKNISIAERYAASLPAGPIREFCAIPLLLASATLDALAAGREKLTREEVLRLVETGIRS